MSNHTVLNHPLVSHHLATLRDEATSSEVFRATAQRLTQFLIIEATKALPTEPKQVKTPLTTTTAQVIPTQLKLILCPILRAGLVMADAALPMLPMASVYHIGLRRNEETFEPEAYYQNLPANIAALNPHVLLLDPMLATGGSALSAIELLVSKGIPAKHIQLLSLIASPEGMEALKVGAPEVTVTVAAQDERLNEKAYIVPGLGDAGDRTFGTV